jgi:hypothetical protein
MAVAACRGDFFTRNESRTEPKPVLQKSRTATFAGPSLLPAQRSAHLSRTGELPWAVSDEIVRAKEHLSPPLWRVSPHTDGQAKPFILIAQIN